MLAERSLVYEVNFDMNMLQPYKIALDLLGEKYGFRLRDHTPKRGDEWAIPQIIFNVAYIR